MGMPRVFSETLVQCIPRTYRKKDGFGLNFNAVASHALRECCLRRLPKARYLTWGALHMPQVQGWVDSPLVLG